MRAEIDQHPQRTTGQRVARVVTEVFAPAALVAGLLLLVAWHSAATARQALVWGILAASFASFLPISYIIRGARRGRWDSHHVRERERRSLPLLVTMGSVAVGLGLLTYWGAPRDLLALVGAMLTGLVVTLAVTHWWKVSVHTAVAGGTAVILVAVFGPALLAVWPMVGVIGWSRVRLGDHTAAQVAVGSLLGGLVAAIVFPLLR